jgi:hypothetical protein
VRNPYVPKNMAPNMESKRQWNHRSSVVIQVLYIFPRTKEHTNTWRTQEKELGLFVLIWEDLFNTLLIQHVRCMQVCRVGSH